MQSKRSSKSSEERLDWSTLDSHQAAVESTFHFDQDSPMMEMSLSMHEDLTTGLWQKFIPDMSDDSPSDLSMTPSNIFDQDFLSINTPSLVPSTGSRSTENIFNFEDDFPAVPDLGPQHHPSQPELSMSINSLPTPAPSDISSLLPRYDCTRLASSTLDSLNLNSQTCSVHLTQLPSSTEPIIASLDQILIANKSAVENAHKLLSCPCSLSQQSNLILSLIIDKILALYQTIIRTDISANQLFPCSDAAAEKFVRDTPITIGAYKMDAKDEQRMRMQLVSNELRKAAALVEKYADKYCGQGIQKREDQEIYTVLTSLLRRRLKKAVDDIVNALRNL